MSNHAKRGTRAIRICHAHISVMSMETRFAVSLRTKTLSMVIVTMLISIAALFFIASSVYQNSYGEIERSGADKDLQRLESVFVDELSQMFALLEDYASWDDTYAFAQSRSQDYIDSNLSGDTFSNLGVQVLMMLGRNGQLLHASSYDLPADKSSNAVQQLRSLLGPEGELHSTRLSFLKH